MCLGRSPPSSSRQTSITYIDDLGAKHPEVTVHRDDGKPRPGVAVGKPFSISTICVVDAGDSDPLTLESNV